MRNRTNSRIIIKEKKMIESLSVEIDIRYEFNFLVKSNLPSFFYFNVFFCRFEVHVIKKHIYYTKHFKIGGKMNPSDDTKQK